MIKRQRNTQRSYYVFGKTAKINETRKSTNISFHKTIFENYERNRVALTNKTIKTILIETRLLNAPEQQSSLCTK